MILSLAMSPDGRYMASGDEDGTIMMWDLASGRCVTPLMGHTSCVWTLAYRFLLLVTNAYLKISDKVSTVFLFYSLTIIYFGCASCEGSLLASGSADCTVKLWDVTTSTKVLKTEEK